MQTITKNTENTDTFAPRLLTWFDDYGRHDLPWQQHRTDTPDVYQVWLSEVMLQQTQVKTVIPYFQRFIQSFPTVHELANAEWESVAEHWAGLGYYARARNLHKGARQVVAIITDTGNFPQTVSEWEQIAGVGRSTAGAIVAMGLHRYGVICDGNVKRVLTRWAGIDGDISKSATNKTLWALAESLTPTANSGDFAQAIMDMGATVCVRTKPTCLQNKKDKTNTHLPCPIQADCIAYSQGEQLKYPVKAKKASKPSKYSQALLITNPQDEVLWIQRPDSGIWGGLWSLPLIFTHKIIGKKTTKITDNDNLYEKELNTAEQIIDSYLQQLNKSAHQANQADTTTQTVKDKTLEPKPIKHTLTHFHWYLTPQYLTLTEQQATQLSQHLHEANIAYHWLEKTQAGKKLALPKAMLKIID